VSAGVHEKLRAVAADVIEGADELLGFWDHVDDYLLSMK